jgi:hypothetical protein
MTATPLQTVGVQTVAHLEWEITNRRNTIVKMAKAIEGYALCAQSEEVCPTAYETAHYARIMAQEARQMAAVAGQIDGLMVALEALKKQQAYEDEFLVPSFAKQ